MNEQAQHLAALEAQLAQLVQLNAVLQAAVEHYADERNWHEIVQDCYVRSTKGYVVAQDALAQHRAILDATALRERDALLKAMIEE